MTPPSRSPDQRVAGYPPRGGRGAAGTAGLDNGLAGGPSGIGVGGGPPGTGIGVADSANIGVVNGPGGIGVARGPVGTGEAGGPAGTDNGVVGSARIGAAVSRPGIGNGLTARTASVRPARPVADRRLTAAGPARSAGCHTG
jgi:hypothetical protein